MTTFGHPDLIKHGEYSWKKFLAVSLKEYPEDGRIKTVVDTSLQQMVVLSLAAATVEIMVLSHTFRKTHLMEVVLKRVESGVDQIHIAPLVVAIVETVPVQDAGTVWETIVDFIGAQGKTLCF